MGMRVVRLRLFLFFEGFPGLEEDLLLGSVFWHLGEGLTGPEFGVTVPGKLLVQLRAEGFPFQHFIRYRFDDAGGIAHDQTPGGNIHSGFDEAEGPHDAACSYVRIVHDHGIHADHGILSDGSPMNNGSVSDMRAGLQQRSSPGKHVYDAVFLHIAAGFNYNCPPVPSEYGSRTNIDGCSDDHIANHGSLWMHERPRCYYGYKAFK